MFPKQRHPIFFVNIHLLYIDASFSKSALNHSADLARRKSSAALPELNSRTDFAVDLVNPDSNITRSSPTKNTCLPILGKEGPTRSLNKQVDKECKLLPY